ncbi:hypothetical protein Tco_0770171 [Tanacetum coccineum]|uniref:Integrase, catalytic region, zinc finger, CCHC-type, peptidase aspartic, catalytic n=1 Tax=Tanacetum coccineum TaxID=301880 RepID=A0ABQ4ZES6_9ASTR
MWHSIENGPYVSQMIPTPDDTTQQIIKPLSKMTEINNKQYNADVRVMNYLLQAIPNDIYNSVDAYKNAKEMWEQIKRLMYGSDVTNHVRHSRIMDEFDKFATKEGESLESLYERLTNALQFEPHIQASKAKRAARNHDPLALIAHSNASSQSHVSPSYSNSPQPYYVTHPSSVIDYEEDYQGELQGDSQKDKLTIKMINQAVIQDGRVDIQTKNAGYGGNSDRNTGRQNRNQAFNACNVNDESHYSYDYKKPRVRDAKYFREQMLLAMKDEAESNLNAGANDFMLDNCAFMRSSAKSNLSSSCNVLPSCALVKKYTISEFAEALTPL